MLCWTCHVVTSGSGAWSLYEERFGCRRSWILATMTVRRVINSHPHLVTCIKCVLCCGRVVQVRSCGGRSQYARTRRIRAPCSWPLTSTTGSWPTACSSIMCSQCHIGGAVYRLIFGNYLLSFLYHEIKPSCLFYCSKCVFVTNKLLFYLFTNCQANLLLLVQY